MLIQYQGLVLPLLSSRQMLVVNGVGYLGKFFQQNIRSAFRTGTTGIAIRVLKHLGSTNYYGITHNQFVHIRPDHVTFIIYFQLGSSNKGLIGMKCLTLYPL